MKELTMRDKFNAKNAGEKPEAYIGQVITAVALGQFMDNVTDMETGEVTEKPISVIVTKDNHTITTPSATLNKALNDLIALCEEEKLKEIDIKIAHGTSNAGRKFLTIMLA